MTDLRRFLLGGLGAMTPLIVSFVIVDAGTLTAKLGTGETFWALGLGLRAVGLFILGGVWVWIQASDTDPKKVFQLGIAAPAIIVGMLNVNNVKGPSEAAAGGPLLGLHLISPAHAQVLKPDERKDIRKPIWTQIVDGIVGRP